MTMLAFKYTKPDGAVSERLLLVVAKPESNYKGWELSELSPEDAAALSEELSLLNLEFKEQQIALLKKYDARFSFRSFKPNNMTCIEEITC